MAVSPLFTSASVNQNKLAKSKTVYICSNCGSNHSKWMGQCTSCHEWNTLIEEIVQPQKNQKTPYLNTNTKAKPTFVNQIKAGTESRIITQNNELNRVLGGGLVIGSVVLLGGEPGIGKSTLLLQLALESNNNVLYISGEESPEQIKLRADRIGLNNNLLQIYAETALDQIISEAKLLKPDFLIVDSIQTLVSPSLEAIAGSISQIKQCTAELIQFAKTFQIPIILVGHINKDGQIAGPKLLEHMVDVVLQFEGDHNHIYRILRAQKNRFGSTSEIGVYSMINSGLSQISNPSGILLNERTQAIAGTAIAVAFEGGRTLLTEVQALVSSAVYGTPQRASNGYPVKRLNMMLAVLEKRAGFQLAAKDVFLNITGGLQIEDPAIDLAVIAAILSSNIDRAIPNSFCFSAEVGLGGEIRPTNRIEERMGEANKLGFKRIFMSSYNKKNHTKQEITKTLVANVSELLSMLFE